MRKIFVLLISVLLVFMFAGCSGKATVKETFDDGFKIYYEMSDGTWECKKMDQMLNRDL